QRTPQTFLPTQFCRTTHGHWHNNVAQHQIENGVFDASVEYAAGRLCFIKLLNVEHTLESGANLLSQCVTPLLADIWRQIEENAHNASVPAVRQASTLLTPAEREVHRWLRQRKTNWEIGKILGKSELTVKTQVQKMLKKTGLESRHALAACDF
ncbi:MAG: helix-turn-helix transcriptional regulator, partial [Burkholderiales bacterium]|nr:helix-turn-helix transcriptional regulator [Burkholderiales bacterium]